ncbi:hypothetical protein BGZ70_000119 [Mortierella alpina]|uniref:GPI anchored protein n=1 Tax=Mortierella alpina TaxID=64518 RepID=A0A9P6LYB6_MORAP|nr:hypothetical protein BGZ70_000119 [Mortierella alpina]
MHPRNIALTFAVGSLALSSAVHGAAINAHEHNAPHDLDMTEDKRDMTSIGAIHSEGQAMAASMERRHNVAPQENQEQHPNRKQAAKCDCDDDDDSDSDSDSDSDDDDDDDGKHGRQGNRHFENGAYGESGTFHGVYHVTLVPEAPVDTGNMASVSASAGAVPSPSASASVDGPATSSGATLSSTGTHPAMTVKPSGSAAAPKISLKTQTSSVIGLISVLLIAFYL